MPSYRTHDRVNLVAYGLALLGYGAAAHAGVVEPVPLRPLFVGTLAYFAGTFLLSPDLDLRVARPGRRWGWLRVLWMPYASLMTHRRLSHGYVVGPLTRLLYLALLLTPLTLVPAVYEPLRASLLAFATHDVGLAALGGYYAATYLHLLLDRAPLRP